MDTIVGWFKSIVGFVFGTLFLSFISGYLIGNYYATKAAVQDKNLITPHNIISMTLLRVYEVPGAEKYTYKNYDESKAK